MPSHGSCGSPAYRGEGVDYLIPRRSDRNQFVLARWPRVRVANIRWYTWLSHRRLRHQVAFLHLPSIVRPAQHISSGRTSDVFSRSRCTTTCRYSLRLFPAALLDARQFHDHVPRTRCINRGLLLKGTAQSASIEMVHRPPSTRAENDMAVRKTAIETASRSMVSPAAARGSTGGLGLQAAWKEGALGGPTGFLADKERPNDQGRTPQPVDLTSSCWDTRSILPVPDPRTSNGKLLPRFSTNP
jgi:hypothetical protein